MCCVAFPYFSHLWSPQSISSMQIPSYRPHFLLRNGNANTIFSDVKRNNHKPFPYTRKRLETPDGDFLDVDYYRGGNPRIAYILHGLESSSQGSYVVGMAHLLKSRGWDIAAINYRSCSGEINRTKRIYYAGATDDVDFVLRDFVEEYQEVAMLGFSFGGSLTLRYAGEQKAQLHPHIKVLTAVSVPLDLAACSDRLDNLSSNFVYKRIFLQSFREKVRAKSHQFPDTFHEAKLKEVKTIFDFDNIFTGPLHGFPTAEAYYEGCSSMTLIPHIQRPTLILNAQDDPFLAKGDYRPYVEPNPFIHMPEIPYGGHVGFSYLTRGYNWMQNVVSDWMEEAIAQK